MESMLVNWEALDSLVIDFVKSERLVEGFSSSASSNPSSPSTSSSASSAVSSASASSSSSYHSRLLIRQIRRRIETGDVDATVELLRTHAPGVLDDHRILFRLQKQKFIELLRRGTDRDRDSAIQCLRMALAPCALDAYPEAYEEFKHVLLALIFVKEDESSPVASEWSERRRFDLAGLLSSMLRAYLQAYDPVLSMTLRYLISIHKVFCLRQGISSPISDLTERLLFEDHDAPAIPPESSFQTPPFDEVDIQALAHAVELTRQGAVDSLKFAKGDLFQAFQNELCRMRLDVSILDDLVHEYCVYRGITASSTTSSSDLATPQLAHSSSRECTSRLSDGEASDNIGGSNRLDANIDYANTRDNESVMHCSSEMTANHEDCSTSDANHLLSFARRLRRSRYDVSKERMHKRWRGRGDIFELACDATIPDKSKQHTVLLNSNDTVDKYEVSRKCFSIERSSSIDEHKYEILLEMKELASKGMAAEVVEEVNAVDPEFFTENPIFLFQLKQIEFFQLVNRGYIPLALKVASAYLGPLAASNQELLKSLKETLFVLLKPNEEAISKGISFSVLATSLQGLMNHYEEIVKYFNNRGVSAILLFRRNHLQRLVSLLANTHDQKFKQLNGTHRAHVHSKGEADILARFKPQLNAKHLVASMQDMHTLAADALQNFENCRHMLLHYEDLVQNQTKMMDVLEFLNVPRRRLVSRHVKIHTNPLKEQIDNWKDVIEVIKGTQYESFIAASDY